MSEHKAIAVRPSVDWITCSYKSTNQRVIVKTMADSLIEREVLAGNRITKGSFNGYHTVSCGETLFGEREDGYLVRLTGVTAHKHFLPFLAYASNVTRIDLAATVKLDRDPTGFVEASYDEATIGLDEAHQRRLSLIQNVQGGATFYVGSRTSQQYGRLYNKYAEQKKASNFLNCVRYEVEFKKPLSLQVAMQLQREENIDEWIAAYVRQWFLTRGIIPVYLSTTTVNAIQIARKESDNERTLKWLGKTVHSAYRQLELAGLGSVAIEAVKNGLSVNDDKNLLANYKE